MNAPPHTPLRLLLDRSNPDKFQITALGDAGPWRLRTPAEPDGDQWQFVVATFEQTIRIMDAWIRHRREGAHVLIEPSALYAAIVAGRLK